MRAAFLVTGYPVPGSIGGVFHRTLAEALVRAGVEVEVVAPVPRVPRPLAHFNARWADYGRLPEQQVADGVLIKRPRYWQLPRANYLGTRHDAFARCLRVATERRFDIIHAHFAYPCGLAASEVGAGLGVPVVLTLHGGDVNAFPQMNRRTRRLFGEAVNGATAVLAVSEALAERAYQLSGRKPAVMPIGLNLRRFDRLPTSDEARKLLGLPVDSTIILFVGSLLEAKGVSLLLRSLQDLPQKKVLGVFVGDGPLRAAVVNHPKALSVGAIPNERVPLYMRAADVLVLPSFSEGMPTALVEAGAAGVPVVATAVGGISELLDGDRGVVIPPGKGSDLAGALARVFQDPSAARERSVRLRDHVLRNYDVDRNAKSLIQLYENLSGQSPGHRVSRAISPMPVRL